MANVSIMLSLSYQSVPNVQQMNNAVVILDVAMMVDVDVMIVMKHKLTINVLHRYQSHQLVIDQWNSWNQIEHHNQYSMYVPSLVYHISAINRSFDARLIFRSVHSDMRVSIRRLSSIIFAVHWSFIQVSFVYIYTDLFDRILYTNCYIIFRTNWLSIWNCIVLSGYRQTNCMSTKWCNSTMSNWISMCQTNWWHWISMLFVSDHCQQSNSQTNTIGNS